MKVVSSVIDVEAILGFCYGLVFCEQQGCIHFMICILFCVLVINVP